MSRVITFSRKFPAYHPKAGESTHFVEKFWKAFDKESSFDESAWLPSKVYGQLNDHIPLNMDIDWAKYHTIRSGSRWKVGDRFSPRVWSGVPYQSKQIIIAPDVEVKKVWDFEIKPAYKMLPLDYDTDIIINHSFYHTDDEIMKTIAQNDGLSLSELLQWFKYPKPFSGQIICWSEKIEYA